MGDKIREILKKYFPEFFLFFFFYLGFVSLMSKRINFNFFEIFKFISAFSLFILFKLLEDKKEYIKEVPFIFLFLFIFSIPLLINSYFLKKFFLLFILTPFILRFERLKVYLKENFILEDILYSFLHLYLFFLILPYKFPFFPEVWALFIGFYLLNFLKYFSEKIKFPFEEKIGIMTYSKYMGFYTSLFFILSFYFSIFFIFLSFWRGCNFSFLFPLILLFALLKNLLFLLLRILDKKTSLSDFLKKEALFFKYSVYFAFIVESFFKFLPFPFLKI